MNWRNESVRFSKFLVVGFLGFIVDFGTFNVLTAGFGWNPTVSQAISFSCAVTCNFLWNRYWVYPDSRTRPVGAQILLFAGINIVGLIIRTPLFISLTPVWSDFLGALPVQLPMDLLQLAHNLALACAVVVVLIWNFVVNRLWTYNDVR